MSVGGFQYGCTVATTDGKTITINGDDRELVRLAMRAVTGEVIKRTKKQPEYDATVVPTPRLPI